MTQNLQIKQKEKLKSKMEKLSKLSEYKLTLIYALRDLSRNYKKISSIILTLFISLFILSSIFTIEDSLNKELNNLKNPNERAKELLDRFGLKNRFNNLPSQLSGGEQQRVAIARAIAMKPKLILADEPTGNLDSENSQMIADILFKYIKEEKSSLIMVTHDLKLANKAKRKIKIKDGKIV
jgi:putative ABC transport system ATP-binding protein